MASLHRSARSDIVQDHVQGFIPVVPFVEDSPDVGALHDTELEMVLRQDRADEFGLRATQFIVGALVTGPGGHDSLAQSFL